MLNHWRQRLAFCFDARNPDALFVVDDADWRATRRFLLFVSALGASVGFFWLLGYLWSLLPHVPSFTQLADNSTSDAPLTPALDGMVIFIVTLYVYYAVRTGHELATRQCWRRPDEDMVAGALAEEECHTPHNTRQFVGLTIAFFLIFFVPTVGAYLLALLGNAVSHEASCSLVNGTTVLCWRTEGECLCALATAFVLVCIGAAFFLLYLIALGCRIFYRRARLALKDDEEIPLLKAAHCDV